MGNPLDIAYDKAVLLGLWLETLFYGIYLPVFFTCVWILTYRRPSKRYNWPIITAACLNFVLSTIHIAVGLRRLLDGFINHQKTEPILYFLDLSRFLNVFSDGVYVTNNIITDTLVVYRCYVVWDRRFIVVIVPALTVVAFAVTGYMAVSGFSRLSSGQTAFASQISTYARTAFALSLVCNVTATALIASRILHTTRLVRQSFESGPTSGRVQMYYGILAVIVESAAIWSVSLAIFLGLYIGGSNAQYVIFCALCQITSLVGALIIVRIGLGITHPNLHIDDKSTNWTYSAPVFTPRGDLSRSGQTRTPEGWNLDDSADRVHPARENIEETFFRNNASNPD